jgi:formamidopyrimidine-DNA glycosylase
MALPELDRTTFQESTRLSHTGEPCVRCASTGVKMVAAGRRTYVCETCQPRPRARRPQPVGAAR